MFLYRFRPPNQCSLIVVAQELCCVYLFGTIPHAVIMIKVNIFLQLEPPQWHRVVLKVLRGRSPYSICLASF